MKEKMLEIRRIMKENAKDLGLKNEPFSMPGRLIPALKDGVWSYRIELFEQPGSLCFPDEAYDYDTLAKDSVIFGAYVDDTCVGLAIFQNGFFEYMYLLDLKVCAAARGKGVGKALIQAGLEAAKERNYRGVYLQAQDDNLNACLFYLKTGFVIGGFDNRVYCGSRQEGKADVIFYLDA